MQLVCLLFAAAAITVTGDPPEVRVTGASATGGALRVFIAQPDAPALAGSTRMEAGTLIFTPRYRLQPGLAYRARYEAAGAAPVETVLRIPAAKLDEPRARVERILPSAAEWPENTLRFYIHFSRPMSRAEAFERLHLIDLTEGREVSLPFLEIEEELWDREQRRLTVLFDPGRVKRGLVPHAEAGPPLVAGRRYRLVVDDAWRDAANRPLESGFTKEFTAGKGVREGIEPAKTWRLQAPRAGTRDPLVVRFPRPLDSALLLSCLSPLGVAGSAALAEAETQWTFTPDAPWPDGPATLLVAGRLEDVAGNRLGRVFDVDVFDEVTSRRESGEIRLSFQPWR